MIVGLSVSMPHSQGLRYLVSKAAIRTSDINIFLQPPGGTDCVQMKSTGVTVTDSSLANGKYTYNQKGLR